MVIKEHLDKNSVECAYGWHRSIALAVHFFHGSNSKLALPTKQFNGVVTQGAPRLPESTAEIGCHYKELLQEL
jgi:hypothetical protein